MIQLRTLKAREGERERGESRNDEGKITNYGDTRDENNTNKKIRREESIIQYLVL